MTESIHSCSYQCQRPACVLRQRNELLKQAEHLHAEVLEQARLLGISGSVEARLLAQADRDAALLRQALEALEYAADATEPIRPDACGCPLCVAATAIRERLGEKG